MMEAVVFTEYGSPDVLRLGEVPAPVPKDNEIRVRVYATPVSFGDVMARNFKNVTPRAFSMPLPLWLLTRIAFGVRRPNKQVLGSEFAGKVEAVGKAVRRFRVGDAVFGYRAMNFGANAEYLCMPEDGLVAPKPASMTYQEAAALSYGALTALNLLRQGGVQQGERVLINGASGAIGSYAVQLAKYFGAHVTGVCSTAGVEVVKALGADRVIDYTREDFTTDSETYDLVFDVLGKSSFSRVRHVLKPDGRYLLASFKMRQLGEMVWTSLRGGKRVVCALSSEKPQDLMLIGELAEAGKIKVIIDRCYPLEQAADAHRYVEGGHKRGSVVLTLAPAV
jgi:NADPH:quinone reductase-like Zn-dependent oxidoreductase